MGSNTYFQLTKRAICPGWRSSKRINCLYNQNQFHLNYRIPSVLFEKRQWKSNNFLSSATQVYGIRHASTISPPSVQLNKMTDYLEISHGTQSLRLSWLWLRDHCRCKECYNHSTNQKNMLIDPETRDESDVQLADVVLDSHPKSLQIIWKDGHKTNYDLDWLIENTYSGKKDSLTKPFLWNRKYMNSVDLPVVNYTEHMETEAGLKQSLHHMAKYGFTIVQGASPTIEDTKKVAKRIGHVMKTCFGGMWSFTADQKRADTAYSNLAIGPHTDTTYYTHPAGIQVFHCMEHDGEGGETLLVDGFQIANKLREEHPEDFNYLTKATVAHEYIDQQSRDNYYSLGQILSLSPVSEQLSAIRFNIYDLAPLSTIPQDEIETFYTAYNRLRRGLFHTDNELRLKLKPGMVLFVDNWRALHGRSSFTGKRVVCGCYINREDLENSYRRYGLL